MKRPIRWLAILVGWILACSSLALAATEYVPCKSTVHARIPKIAGLTYAKARKALLAQGWRPLRTKPANAANVASADPDLTAGNGPVFWRRGYVELESCAGTGLAPCAFLFKDAHGNRLRLSTEGEEDPETRIQARVRGFELVCPRP